MSKILTYLMILIFILGMSLSLHAAPFSQDEDPDGIVAMEAENFDNNTSQGGKTWELVTDPVGFTGTGAMAALPNTGGNNNTGYVENSPRLDYEIDFALPGMYYVWVRASAANGTDDSWHAGLDGSAVDTADRGSLGSSGNWEWNNSDMDGGRVTITISSTGVHMLNIWMREDGAIIDKIVMTTNPDYTPTEEGPTESPRGPRTKASDADPAPESEDISRDVILSWTSGEFAATHDVYFGASFNDVNEASRSNPMNVLVSQDQSANTFDPGRLTFFQTYFWRVDEVNAAPDNHIYKGGVWSFTVEPVSYAIPTANITATASTSVDGPDAPARTIDGSGLNENDQHSTLDGDIWLSGVGDVAAWIQYEFDKPYKLDKMLVWNANSVVELNIGWGLKEIVLETSLDGETWTVFEGVTQLAQGTGSPDYGPETHLLNNITAKYVRITAISNWGGVLPQYGLSEVRFYFNPTYAREPQPEDGAEVLPPVMAQWRAGREAVDHTIYIDTDANAVQDETAVSQSLQTEMVDLGALGILLGETHYWKINEVNNTEDPPVWKGSLWNFTIPDPLVVDDFENYSTTDIARRPYVTWRDGLDFSNPPPGGSGNGTGAVVGHDIFSPGSPYFDGDLMELELIHGGAQSLPLYYDNAAVGNSEMTRTITTNQDWTQYGITTLVLYFRGVEGNSGQLYVKINDTKVLYPGDAAAISRPLWQQWNIDLSSVGGSVTNVQSLTVGIEGAGSGLIYVDDILLYRDAPPVPEPVDP